MPTMSVWESVKASYKPVPTGAKLVSENVISLGGWPTLRQIYSLPDGTTLTRDTSIESFKGPEVLLDLPMPTHVPGSGVMFGGVDPITGAPTGILTPSGPAIFIAPKMPIPPAKSGNGNGASAGNAAITLRDMVRRLAGSPVGLVIAVGAGIFIIWSGARLLRGK